jgi:hypothetical protein
VLAARKPGRSEPRRPQPGSGGLDLPFEFFPTITLVSKSKRKLHVFQRSSRTSGVSPDALPLLLTSLIISFKVAGPALATSLNQGLRSARIFS